MKGISVFLYSLKQGLKNIRKNGMFSLASICTIAACLFLFGIFYFSLSNFQYMIKNAETSVGVTVFFNEGISQEQIDSLKSTIIQSRSEVKEVKYVSAQEAWEKFKSEMFANAKDLADTFEDDNPLSNSASFEIYLKDISKQTDLVNYLKGLDGIRQVNSSNTTANSLHNVNVLVGYISVTIIIILLVVAVFLINTTISVGISVRKAEIEIMRLVGASDLFIKAPFIVEGVFIGFIGAGIPLIILWFLYHRIISFISTKFQVLSDILVFLDAKTVFAALTPICFGIGMGIGLIGSLITIRRHLKI